MNQFREHNPKMTYIQHTYEVLFEQRVDLGKATSSNYFKNIKIP